MISPQQLRTMAEGLKILNENREKVGELLEFLDEKMPNVETKTMGGKVFWNDIASYGGWRVQQNKVMKNCRILDPDDVRIAWGGESAMIRAFKVLFPEEKKKFLKWSLIACVGVAVIWILIWGFDKYFGGPH